MASEYGTGTFGFRFKVPTKLSMCELFAVGKDVVKHTSYEWDGLKRSDGPLLLFQYTLEGNGIFESEAKTYQIRTGQAFMAEIPGNHKYFFPDGGAPWSFIFVLLRPTLILPNWLEAKRKLGEAPFLPLTSGPVFALQHLYEEARAGRITNPYSASSLSYHFISELCRYASFPNEHQWPKIVKEAVTIINSHYDRMLSLDQLAERLGISKYHFQRVFKAEVGSSPNEYLNRVRVEKAMHLLRLTNWSVEEIAERVGYSSGSYLIKVFRKLTGQTPGRFRSHVGKLAYNRIFYD